MRLTKHHALGNDFLVLDGAPATPDPELARSVCDRHRGIGADGLLYLGRAHNDIERRDIERRDSEPTEIELTMVLLNADGGRAEMSGNGIGCLAQAALLANPGGSGGLGGPSGGKSFRVRTDAGPRAVELLGAHEPGTHQATVEMGPWTPGPDASEWVEGAVLRALRVSVGNPHLVLQVSDAGRLKDREWVAELGARANAEIPGGINLEVVAAEGGELVMDVFERGVGLTDACGTGAVASAVAANQWGLVGERVEVRMYGGQVQVAIDGAEPRLTTTVIYIGAVDLPQP